MGEKKYATPVLVSLATLVIAGLVWLLVDSVMVGRSIAALGSKNAQKRADAIDRLSKTSSPAAFSSLVKVLADPEADRLAVQGANRVLERRSADAVAPLFKGIFAEPSGEGAGHKQMRRTLEAVIVPALEGNSDAITKVVKPRTREEWLYEIQLLRLMEAPAGDGFLAGLLKDPDAAVRKAAAEALGRQRQDPPAAEARDALVAALSDADGDVRSAALAALAATGLKQASTLIVPLLKDTNASVRRQAADALAGLEGPEVVRAAIAALGDTDASVRKAAAYALECRRDRLAVEPLIEALADPDDNVRRAAAYALGILGDPKATPALIETGRKGDLKYKVAVIDSLGWLGDAAAVEELVAFAKDPSEELRLEAVHCLGATCGERTTEALIAALGDSSSKVRGTAAESLAALAEARAAEPLRSLMGGRDFYCRAEAAEALGAIRDRAAVRRLFALLADQEWSVRLKAVEALGRVGDRRAVPILLAMLKDPFAGGPGTPLGDALAAEFAGDESEEFAGLRAGGFGRANAKTAVLSSISYNYQGKGPRPTILFERGESPRRKLQCSVAQALGQLGDEAAIEPLLELLSTDSVYVVAGAAEALGRMKVAAAVEPLADIMLNGGDGKHPFSPKYSRMGPTGPVRVDFTIVARNAAACALGRIGSPEAVGPLIAALDEMPVPAARALSMVQDPRAVEPLVSCMKKNREQLRRTVAVALASFDEARAREAVEWFWTETAGGMPDLAEAARDRVRIIQDADSEGFERLLFALETNGDYAFAEDMYWCHTSPTMREWPISWAERHGCLDKLMTSRDLPGRPKWGRKPADK